MRSDRLLSCLLLLQGGRRTARELAGALAVSVRTVYRDVEALALAGVPVHAERGGGGGIVLADEYRRAVAHFSGDELRSLFAATGSLDDVGFPAPAAALEKLLGLVPREQRRIARETADRFLVDQNRWYREDQPRALLARLRDAVIGDRRLRLRYRGRDGAAGDREADPLGMVVKAGIWYLVARIDGGELRSFRADRIVAAEETGVRFVRPAGFALATYWRESAAALERRPARDLAVTLRVRNAAIDGLRRMWTVEVLDDGPEWTHVVARFSGEETAIVALLLLGDDGALIDPPELGAALAARAASVLAQYEKQPAR